MHIYWLDSGHHPAELVTMRADDYPKVFLPPLVRRRPLRRYRCDRRARRCHPSGGQVPDVGIGYAHVVSDGFSNCDQVFPEGAIGLAF